ncbi:Nucleoside diphosphate kinase 6 [Trichoplax sp. H2]|uniref:Nucleoside diphosphate kinase n=1 Tax=Trichoplax adhaerens TaxID=10228 RepID=B3S2N2_TRIAD|nr:hypothetical protein TRIADDRAFT_58087 [Trichoplax adhaerens]EDV23126.1 hypothetical protein TRIADDRAFT_58087 [Trichoplax adhaerens]RDD47854.1 Nucleoside diphosphate kinase 6 [Trichoplax sp. H2]|eukprot:XP_002114036.1 hypothetical protein TRIADDRAFT_58087 [Trichoplax adhaerens]
MAKIQATLAIFKPDIMLHPSRVQKIQQLIEKNGIKVFRKKPLTMDVNTAEKFYGEHQGKFFYPRLVNLMTGGPATIAILVGNNAITHWRDLIGPSRSHRARSSHPSTIRAIYGLTDTRNAVHGSDSVESAAREIQFFFPELDYDDCVKQCKT